MELIQMIQSTASLAAIAMILIMMGIFVKILSFDGLYPSMEYALPTVSIILLLAVPIITMRSFSETASKRRCLFFRVARGIGTSTPVNSDS